MNHLHFQPQFPVKTNRLKGADPVAACTKEAVNLRKTTQAVKPSKKVIQNTAKKIDLKINEPFKTLQPIYNINLADALTKVPETGLTHAKTKVQKYRNGTEEQWAKVDYGTTLGTRQSFKQRALQRKPLYFESREEAEIWTNKRKALEEADL